MTSEERKLDKLNRQYGTVCRDLVSSCGTVRTLPYGMDRYRRCYWRLPSLRGLLVESRECSVVDDSSSGVSDCLVKLAKPTKAASADDNHVKEENPTLPDTSHSQTQGKTTPNTAIAPLPQKLEVDLKSEPMDTSTPTSQSNPVRPNQPDTVSSTPLKPAASDSQSACTISGSTSLQIQQAKQPTNASPSAHSIASWLSSTIDSIFGAAEQETKSPAIDKSVVNSSHDHTSNLSTAPTVVKVEKTPNTNEWFELNR